MKKILFVCVGNSCRSQMAEGFAKYYAKKYHLPDIVIESAGTLPAESVNPLAIEVMKEKNIDISQHRPKKITVEELKNFDIIISMGCDVQQYCPALNNENVIDWNLPDPIGKPVDEYRRVRDIIEKKVKELLEIRN